MNELWIFSSHTCMSKKYGTCIVHVYTGMDNQWFEFSTLIKSQLISSGSLFKHNEI